MAYNNLTKLGQIAVLMSTAISLSLVKIGLKTKDFYYRLKSSKEGPLSKKMSPLVSYTTCDSWDLSIHTNLSTSIEKNYND